MSSLPPISSPRSRGNSEVSLDSEERGRRSRGNSLHDTENRAAVAAVTLSESTLLTSTSSSGASSHHTTYSSSASEASLSSVLLSTQVKVRRDYLSKLFSRDFFIEFVKEEFFSAFLIKKEHIMANYMQKCIFIEELVEEHIRDSQRSRLKYLVPNVGTFHTPLHIREAFTIIDKERNISKRMHIPPSFIEVKDMLNLSQVLSIGNRLQLATFDGDGTLYDDGLNFGECKSYNAIGEHIAMLLQAGVFVSIVTAAAYGLDGSKYEIRLRGLIDMFVQLGLTEEVAGRFYVLGGQCNYLLQLKYVQDESGKTVAKLVPVEYELWQAESLGGPRPYYWPKAAIEVVLNAAEQVVRAATNPDSESRVFSCEVQMIRKERTMGLISKEPKKFTRDALNEVCFRLKEALEKCDPPVTIPYCIFNGGHDVWTDIGSKGIGIAALQKFLKVPSSQSIHFGDQLLRQGNDLAARETAATIWVANPTETAVNLQRISEKFKRA